MRRHKRSGICPRCGEGWCEQTHWAPAEYCDCHEGDGRADVLEEADPRDDGTASDARELARDWIVS